MTFKRATKILKMLIEALESMDLHCPYGQTGRKRGRQKDLIEECKVLIKRLNSLKKPYWPSDMPIGSQNEDVRLILSEIVMDCQKLDAYNTNN